MNHQNKLQVNQVLPALAARAEFGRVLDLAQQGNRLLINRHGVPTAIIIGIEDYLLTVLEQPELLTSLHKKAQVAGLDHLTLEEIDQEIKAVRTQSKSSNRWHVSENS